MIVRIVKLTLKPEEVDTFLDLFESVRDSIRGSPGCLHLELWRDRAAADVFFTYSRWDSEAELDAYRKSAFFDQVWKKIKALFAAKAEAWSLEKTY